MSESSKVRKNSSTKNVCYKTTANVKGLKINSNEEFNVKIVWKRHRQTSQTKVKRYMNEYGEFNNEILQMVLDLEYDLNHNLYHSKITEICVLKIKDEQEQVIGSVKVDLSEILNKNIKQQNLVLTLNNCIYSEGFVEITFLFQQNDIIQITQAPEQFLTPQKAQIPTKQQSKISQRIEINFDQNVEEDNLDSMVDKMKQLSKRIKQSKQNSANVSPLLIQRIQTIQKQNTQLRSTIKDLKFQNFQSQTKWHSQKKQFQNQIKHLDQTVEKKSNQLNDRTKQLHLLSHKRSSTPHLTIDLRKESFQQGIEKNPFQNSGFEVKYAAVMEQQIQALEKQKQFLENKVSDLTLNMGRLFNAALEIGGPELLDRLQESMRLQGIDQN